MTGLTKVLMLQVSGEYY